jgi:hypothetical protein
MSSPSFTLTADRINGILVYLQVIFAILVFMLSINFLRSFISADDTGLLSAGILSGGLHALTGADHLAALLPSIVGKKWWIAFSLGCFWGLGHSISSSFLATCGYFLEDSVLRFTFMSYVIRYADFAIGLTLLVIGYIGIVESTQPEPIAQIEVESSTVSQAHKAAATIFESFPSRLSPYLCIVKLVAVSSTIFLNGLLLGLSWDGLPSLAPALSADSWHGLIVFLLAYGAGTMAAMAVAAGSLGLCTSWLGSYTHDAVPRQLAYASSILAMLIGIAWIIQASVELWTSYDLMEMFSIGLNRFLANCYQHASTSTAAVICILTAIVLFLIASAANLMRDDKTNKVRRPFDLPHIKADVHIV